MAVIRITDSAYQPIIDRCILSVDVFYSDDPENGSRSFIVVAPGSELLTESTMKAFIEQNILSQQTALPNWTGSSWKSQRV